MNLWFVVFLEFGITVIRHVFKYSFGPDVFVFS